VSQKNMSNMAASVRQRLLNRARAEGRPFQSLAQLYVMERLLFRLGVSSEVERFILKGGLMTMTWAGEYARLTKDIDLLGRGASSVEAVVAAIVGVLGTEVAVDGVLFDVASVVGEHILVDAAYVGVRVRLNADLGGMGLRLQLDVGFGDVVVPAPAWISWPQLLDLGAPRLLGYPPEATLAEKLHAAWYHGHANSRMKDYYDLWSALRLGITTPERVGEAVWYTFSRRGTSVPEGLPPGLRASFAAQSDKQVQWDAFLRKSGLVAPRLGEVVEEVGVFAAAAFAAGRRQGELS
jgi:predicted nucleotidyltransferase component of viral defense system